MNADGTGVRRLTQTPEVRRRRARGRPTGGRCSFYSQRRPKGDVWVMNADGSGQRNLTRNPAYDGAGTLVARRAEDRLHTTATATTRSTS